MSSLMLIELEFGGGLSDLRENLRSGDCWGVYDDPVLIDSEGIVFCVRCVGAMMLCVLLKLDDLDDHDFSDFNFFHLRVSFGGSEKTLPQVAIE